MTTHRLSHHDIGYSQALDYQRLPEPWRERAKIANSFILALDNQRDREDLRHNIIVRLAEVAEEYRQQGRTLSKWGAIKVAEYTRLRFYRDRKRWKRVYAVSLNGVIKDEEGNETEIIHTIPDNKEMDMDNWLDFKSYYQNSQQKTKQAIAKLVRENWRKLSGYDSKLIKQFRQNYNKG